MAENIPPEAAENQQSSNQAEQGVNAEQPEITKEARNMAMLCHPWLFG